jgi:superoxide dismutase, Fe-Mn family
MMFELPDLPYELNSFEPNISEKTMINHFRKIHHGYLGKLNSLIKGTRFSSLDLDTIIKIADGPIFNNAAQVWNHSFYFESLKPSANNNLSGPFAEVINRSFGSTTFFKNSFLKAVISHFGVGWIWVALNHNNVIEIISKNEAGNPLRNGLIPLLACDIWEHAYFLDYQDSITDYFEAFWKLIDWDLVLKRYQNAIIFGNEFRNKDH